MGDRDREAADESSESTRIQLDTHTPWLRCMNPPIVAPTNLPLPLAVSDSLAVSQVMQLIHGFYCNIAALSTKNFQAVAQNEAYGRHQYLRLSRDRLDCDESAEDERRKQESARTGKRQGTKRRREKGMSLLVVIPAPMAGSGCGSNCKILQEAGMYQRGLAIDGGDAGRVCGVFRGRHRACARIRRRCRPGRYCRRRRRNSLFRHRSVP